MENIHRALVHMAEYQQSWMSARDNLQGTSKISRVNIHPSLLELSLNYLSDTQASLIDCKLWQCKHLLSDKNHFFFTLER